ncbi:hypothetical protein TcasGA2_TC006882 [Tribolium castaneum]|uniref:SWIM-type domain-containing protein n=1 Tax=Tribolium castaneum TaxID=7070 RepID=D7EIM9_TRICA|nr:hypothetical protein TcasGA2_TC006882 [Tribolium castaneum]
MMENDLRLSVSEVCNYLQSTPASRNFVEGEAVLNAGHIILCGKTDAEDDWINIFALSLQTSALKNNPHEIKGQIEMLPNNICKIKQMTCTCKAGLGGQCKHISAVLLHCTRISFTKLEKVCSSSSLVNITCTDVLIGPVRECCQNIYDSLHNFDYKTLCHQTFLSKELWFKERQFRITGSRCYGIYTYNKTDWENKSIKYFWPKKFSNKTTRHGIECEFLARQIYEKVEKVTVIQCGLIVPPQSPFLAYSPNGVVMKNMKPWKLLEIKCPVAGKLLQAVAVTRASDLCPKAHRLYKIASDLSKTARRLEQENASNRKKLKTGQQFYESGDFLKRKINVTALHFMTSQLRLQLKKSRGRRFSMEDKIFALSLLKHSPSCYKKLLEKVPFEAGVNPAILTSLEQAVQKMNEHDRVCTVVFDEMSIEPGLSYNKKNDRIDGFKTSEEGNLPFSRTTGMTGDAVAAQVKIVIAALQDIGLEGVATVCDQARSNAIAIQRLKDDIHIIPKKNIMRSFRSSIRL